MTFREFQVCPRVSCVLHCVRRYRPNSMQHACYRTNEVQVKKLNEFFEPNSGEFSALVELARGDEEIRK